MAPSQVPEHGRSLALGDVGKRLVAGIVLLAAALLALKIVAGVVIGLVTSVLTIVAIAVCVVAVIWAARRL